jgi:DNA-binding response OmpR family regulator
MPSSQTVLVVEPDDALRGVLCQQLARHGYHVLPAINALEACELAEGRTVDLLLTEGILPRTTGPALAEQLRSKQPHLVVLYTCRLESDAPMPFLVKPFGPSELLAKVRDVLGT